MVTKAPLESAPPLGVMWIWISSRKPSVRVVAAPAVLSPASHNVGASSIGISMRIAPVTLERHS